eukprot:TRINITY_DN75743_c0_g1_i1.p1 TRINITY_DN75743_c0_g1~~TRINITY_DN75743_c0_g1_i1.p1  ORF type:complete len:390 (-),score=47.43 TRINITY_DN75743_c0_g1_i1:1-1134(-)
MTDAICWHMSQNMSSVPSPSIIDVGNSCNPNSISKRCNLLPHSEAVDVGSNAEIVGYVFMVLVAIQTGIQPAVTRVCVSSTVSGQSLVVAENIVSMIIGMCIAPTGAIKSLSFSHSLSVVGPAAFIYALRSLFKQAAYRRCDGVTFNICNQTKIVFCAIATWLLLSERQNPRQICALAFAVSAGVLLVAPAGVKPRRPESRQVRESHRGWVVETLRSDPSQKTQSVNQRMQALSASPAVGVLLALTTACCSGMGAALSQVAMRQSSRHSAVFNFELALWGLPCALIVGSVVGGDVTLASLVYGWQFRTFFPVALQSFGGLLVSSVVQMKGGVAMGLCTVAGIAVSAVADGLLMRKLPPLREAVAAFLAVMSVAMHQL